MARDLKLAVVLQAVDRATRPIRNVMQGSAGLSRQLKASREALKGLQGQQRDISSFRQLKGAAQQTGSALQEQQAEVRRLSQQLAATNKPTRQMRQEFQQAVRQAQRLKQQHQGQQQELHGLRTRLQQAGIGTRNLGEHEQRLRRSMAEANQDITDQTERLRKLGLQQKRLAEAKASYEKTQALAGSMAATGAAGVASGTGILYAGARLMAPQMAADQQGGIIAAQTGEGREQATRYTQIIQSIRTEGVSDDMAAIGAAVGAVRSTLGALGEVGDDELQRISRRALDMSAVLGGDVAENIQVAAIMMQNGLAKNSDEALDLLTRGMQSVSTQMRGELPEILHEYSTHFRGMGFDGQEAMSLLVEMAKQGKFALDKTGDAIKEFSIRGSDMSKASQEAYESIGLDAEAMSSAIAAGGDGAQRALQTTAKALLNITNPAERANAAIALFGTPVEDLAVDQIPDFLRALSRSKNNLGQVEGAAEGLGTVLRDDLRGDIAKLGGAWTNLTSTMMRDQNGPLRQLTQGITRIVGRVREWIAANPTLAANIVKTAAGLGILMAAGGGLALVLASVLGPIAMVSYGMSVLRFGAARFLGPLVTLGRTALPMAAKGVMLFGKALLATPLGWIIGAIALIAGGAYLIWKNWGTLGPKFAALWEGLKAGALGLWEELKAGFSGGLAGIAATIVNFSPLGLFYRAFAGVLDWFGIELPGRFTEFGGMLLDGMVNSITSRLGAVKEAITGAASSAIGWFKETLGIHSPSRVFAELGGHTMDGLQKGIVQGEGGPLSAVGDMSKRLAAAGAVSLSLAMGAAPAAADLPPDQVQTIRQVREAMPATQAPELQQQLQPVAIPAPADQLQSVRQVREPLPPEALPELVQQVRLQISNSPELEALQANQPIRFDSRPPLAAPASAPVVQVGGDTVEIHVHAAPGMDVQALTQAISAELDRRERAKAARIRSSLHDQE